jgi:acetaldehyde dehydrogenase
MLKQPEVNMVTCAGQATTPMVAAINRVADVYYAETVSSLASLSAGPGTRANIDEFTQTTRTALEKIGGADCARALIILNPAEPSIFMSNTIYCRVRNKDMDAITKACDDCLRTMQSYVPGCRYKMRPILKDPEDDIVMLIVEVEGQGDYLPMYAGNLDIINAAAIRIAENKAKEILGVA